MPDAGSSSYIVTTGPGRTSTIDPLTLKSSSTLSSSRALRSSAALSIVVLPVAGAALGRLIGGNWYLYRRSRDACFALGRPAVDGDRRRPALTGAAVGRASGRDRRCLDGYDTGVPRT